MAGAAHRQLPHTVEHTSIKAVIGWKPVMIYAIIMSRKDSIVAEHIS